MGHREDKEAKGKGYYNLEGPNALDGQPKWCCAVARDDGQGTDEPVGASNGNVFSRRRGKGVAWCGMDIGRRGVAWGGAAWRGVAKHAICQATAPALLAVCRVDEICVRPNDEPTRFHWHLPSLFSCTEHQRAVTLEVNHGYHPLTV